jgi:2-polyprenyl-6-methoxyphenol hydroxylase-like FAD-dependent oxidoreductase
MNGAHVLVYERDASQAMRDQGATLDLHHDSGLMALERAGLIGAFRRAYRVGADRMMLVDQYGTVFLEDFGSEELGPERPEIDRGPLRDLLIDSLNPGTIVWDSQFASMEQKPEGIWLKFANGETAIADIVIAADGANSRIRPYITQTKAIYSGISIVEGKVCHAATAVPEIHKVLGEGKVCALGGEKSLFIGAKGDGSLAFYTGQKADEEWAQKSGIDLSSRTAMLKWFKREFSGWSTFWDGLFVKADSRFIIRPQYFFPLDQTWETLPNLTMIGDAAHVMPPYAGEGVNMAMLDALELAESLLSDVFRDTRSAIASFEENMRERASTTTKMTLAFTEMFHSNSAIQELIKNFRGQTGAR